MLALLAFLPLLVPSSRAVHDDLDERITDRSAQFLWDLFEKRDFPGCSAALVLPDGTVLPVTAGYADRDREREMAPEDRLLSGSIGKTYVTAAANHLRHLGKLDFDGRALDHFEGADWFLRLPNAEEVTIRQLLRHRSGIPRYVFQPDFLPACVAEPDKTWRPEELLAFIFGHDPLHPAGEGWAYSDTNYIVLGMIIEKVSGRPFYDYVEEHLLRPHELGDTVPSDRRRIPGLTQGYVENDAFAEMPERVLADGTFFLNPQFEWCGGGYAASASDLARWAWLLYREEAFDGAYLEEMLDGVAIERGVEYGQGVFLRSTRLGPLHGHDGFMIGFCATMGYLPDHEVAVALMLNTDNSGALGMGLDQAALQLASIATEELER
ncbi:MAG: hypothetical protein CMJ89_04945 [Planctomycetes bacterium]|jgi:D-alanyl-D-alanine carboxypeptidase|nr:hypothetical protein [Planctomycetota bacterium]